MAAPEAQLAQAEDAEPFASIEIRITRDPASKVRAARILSDAGD
jgi:hypothetical protein